MDYFTRLAQRALQRGDSVQPRLPSLFAPRPSLWAASPNLDDLSVTVDPTPYPPPTDRTQVPTHTALSQAAGQPPPPSALPSSDATPPQPRSQVRPSESTADARVIPASVQHRTRPQPTPEEPLSPSLPGEAPRAEALRPSRESSRIEPVEPRTHPPAPTPSLRPVPAQEPRTPPSTSTSPAENPGPDSRTMKAATTPIRSSPTATTSTRDPQARREPRKEVLGLSDRAARPQTGAVPAPGRTPSIPKPARPHPSETTSRERTMPNVPSVQVHIGRVEVRAVMPQAPPPHTPKRGREPRLSLEDYLRGEGKGMS